MKKLLLFFCLLGFLYAKDISGIYSFKSEDDISYIEVFERNGEYHALGFANKSGKSGGKDTKNPNKELRDRDLRGAVFLWGLKKKSDDEYKDGKIYNFEDGAEYHVSIKVKGDTLKIRASKDSLGIFGRTIEWKRVSDKEIKPYLSKRVDTSKIKIPN